MEATARPASPATASRTTRRWPTSSPAAPARRVLFVEPDAEEDNTFPHQHLIDQLRGARFLVNPKTVGQLPQNKDELTVYLSNFDCLIVGDVPAERFTPTQQEVIRSNTYDQGCGLVFVGGPDSYGAGGYQKTPIEAALPVDCEIKAMKAAGRGGLVLIMHASEMADGNNWQKDIAQLAIDRLSANDFVGVMDYNGNVNWPVKFQQVNENKAALKGMVDKMTPGDMMDFDPFLCAQAHDTLTDEKHGLAVKHCIVISDGDPQLNAVGKKGPGRHAAKNGVTCSAVGVATHSAAEDTKMSQMAEGAAKGRQVLQGRKAGRPAGDLHARESASQPVVPVHEGVQPGSSSFAAVQADKLDDPLPDLLGFVRTTIKPLRPSRKCTSRARGHSISVFPILATWQYGLGRSASHSPGERSDQARQARGLGP